MRSRSLSIIATAAVLAVAASTVGVPLMAPSDEAAAAAFGEAVFYVSPSGSDGASGTSTATPWRTIDRVNQQVLRPGDSVLLLGGSRFAGTMRVTAGEAGSAALPVRIGSYGPGRATIAPSDDSAIVVHNTAGVDIRDLNLLGNPGSRGVSGVNAYNDLEGDVKLGGLSIERIEVSGFFAGIAVGGGRSASGFRDVVVSDAVVHDNVHAGLTFYGPTFNAQHPTYAHEQVRVQRVHAYRNRGDASNLVTNSGHGIVLGSVRGAVVDRSRANENGDLCNAPEGPVGIWTYDSDSVTIQRSIADSNRTGGRADGDGFDLDQNVSNSVLQNNLSFHNDGAGFLIYTAQDNGAHHDNVVRYNASVGNGRRLGWLGEITVWGPLTRIAVDHNTVIARSYYGQKPPALRLQTGISAATITNNVLESDGAGALVQAEGLTAGAVALRRNDYFAAGRPWLISWNSQSHTSLTAFRAGTAQERLGRLATGTTVDPRLLDPRVVLVADDGDRSPTDVAGINGLTLTASSPVRAAAIGSTPALTTLAPAVSDLFGTAVQSATAPALGAHAL